MGSRLESDFVGACAHAWRRNKFATPRQSWSLGSRRLCLITWAAYQLHFNLSSATSVHLLLVTVIALRWGFFEASVVSLLSVACLDYFFTQPLFSSTWPTPMTGSLWSLSKASLCW